MFIELTDHLRCPADHPEQFLVLLPDQMDRRRVVTGSLGCPVCGQVFEIQEGIARFERFSGSSAYSRLTPDAVLALLGIEGPGGYVALAGAAGRVAAGLAELLPHVHLVLVDPPEGITGAEHWSVIEAPTLPLKTGSMRGVVVGADLGRHPAWVREAVRAVLPGNRVVVEGEPAEEPGFEIMATAPGIWVGRRPPRVG